MKYRAWWIVCILIFALGFGELISLGFFGVIHFPREQASAMCRVLLYTIATMVSLIGYMENTHRKLK